MIRAIMRGRGLKLKMAIRVHRVRQRVWVRGEELEEKGERSDGAAEDGMELKRGESSSHH